MVRRNPASNLPAFVAGHLRTITNALLRTLSPERLGTSRYAIEPKLANGCSRQFSGDQLDDCTTEFDNWSCEHLRRAARKDAQVIKQVPAGYFFGGYRCSFREPR